MLVSTTETREKAGGVHASILITILSRDQGNHFTINSSALYISHLPHKGSKDQWRVSRREW